MRTNTKALATLTAVAAVVSLAGCGNNSAGGGFASVDDFDPDAKTTITVSGWTIDATPEFKDMAKAFMKKYPNVTIDMKNYQADDYDKQMTADLSAKREPMVIAIKNLQTFYSYVNSGELATLDDVKKAFDGDSNAHTDGYETKGHTYGLAYRRDPYVMFYNKDIFKKTGVAEPDGTWTWDDYVATAKKLKEAMPAAGYDLNKVQPVYNHWWPQHVQSVSLAQTKGANYFSGKYDYMKPYYERFLSMQKEGLSIPYNQSQANSISYNDELDQARAAIVIIGTWATQALTKSQAEGTAPKFEWGMAPLPQQSKATVDKPVTYESITGFAVSKSAKTKEQQAAAKKFVEFCSGKDGAKVLVGETNTPAYIDDEITQQYFNNTGMPKDELSKKAWSSQDGRSVPEIGESYAQIDSLMQTAHSNIMSGNTSVEKGLAELEDQVKTQGLVKE